MFQSFEVTSTPQFGKARVTALRAALADLNVDGFLVPRADEYQGEYVPASAERLAWLTGFGFAHQLPTYRVYVPGGRVGGLDEVVAEVGDLDRHRMADPAGGDRGDVLHPVPGQDGVDHAGVHVAKAGIQDSYNLGAPPQQDRVAQIVEAVTTDAVQQGGEDLVSPVPAAPAVVGSQARVLAKPPVRKLAKDLGVDLASCPASGPNGTVTRADVESVASGSPAGLMPASSVGAERSYREPIKGVRKMMGQAMVSSAFTAPHVTEWVTVDVTRTSEFVARLKARREFADLKVSPLLVLAFACLRAVRRTPVINSYWDEQAQEIERFRQKQLDIRKRLRAVKAGLEQNIKDLGMWMKFINIFLVPLAFAGVGTWLLVSSRKSAPASVSIEPSFSPRQASLQASLRF